MRVALLVLAVLASASKPDQFDLICTGMETAHWNLQTGPVTSRYRVDLQANRWCQGECRVVKPLVEVSPTQLVFDEVKAAYRGDPSERLDFVQRDTGKWGFYNRELQGDGTCEPASFSGFPTPTTKF